MIVSATRSITWRSDVSRSGVPSVPRKYFCATMFVALSDHVAGNSTPSCSNATEPSFQLEMRASRRSHCTWSYGCVPGVVKCLRIPIESRSGAMDMSFPLVDAGPSGPNHYILCLTNPRRRMAHNG